MGNTPFNGQYPVPYYQGPESDAPPEFTRFEYSWLFQPKRTTGVGTVWTSSGAALKVLLKHWNGVHPDLWRYNTLINSDEDRPRRLVSKKG